MATTKITTNSLADSAVTSEKLASSISIDNLSVSGNLTVDTNTLVVDDVNNRVGVGTLTPAYPLDVVGNSQFSGYVLANGGLYFTNINVRISRSSNRMVMRGYSGFGFETNDGIDTSERMAIDSDGNLGIGTTSPSARLHTIATTEQVRFGYDVSNYWNATTSSTGVTTLSSAGSDAKFVFANDVEFGANATIPDVIGNTSFTDDVEVLGEMTVTGQPVLSSLTDSHVMTRELSEKLADDLVQWENVDMARYGDINFGSGTVAVGGTRGSLNTGTALGVNVAGGKIADPFNRSPFAPIGTRLNNFPYSSKRSRIRLIMQPLTHVGDAKIWLWVGLYNSAPPEIHATRGFGMWFDPTTLKAVVHNGTTLTESVGYSHNIVNTESFMMELNYYQGTLTVYINNVAVATVSGGYTATDAPDHFMVYARTELGGGTTENYARMEYKNLKAKFTDL